MTRITYRSDSFYSKTPQTSRYVDYLDYWNGYVVLPSSEDSLILLESKYNKRPDLLSFDLYTTPHLWWIFMLRNPDVIKDPINDFKTGINIYVPNVNSVKRFV